MRRFSLLSKILLWFFLNLFILSLALVILLQVRVRFSQDSPLWGRTGARIETLQHLVPHDLADKPPQEMDDVLQRYAEVFDADIVLLNRYGQTLLAGKKLTDPATTEAICG